MPFHIRNRETERLARELARKTKLGLTEAVHMAISNEIQRREETESLWDRTTILRARVRSRVKDPRPVGKAFRDALYEEKASRVR